MVRATTKEEEGVDIVTTPNLEKLGNEDLVEGPQSWCDIPKISKYG